MTIRGFGSHILMPFVLLAAFFWSSAGSATSDGVATVLLFNQNCEHAAMILADDPSRQASSSQDCLSEDTQESEGEEEDGDAPDLWSLGFPLVSSVHKGLLPCQGVASRQILVGIDRDCRSAMLRC